jgi:hypothetical protein
MLANKINYEYILGVSQAEDSEKYRLIDNKLFTEQLRPSTSIKSIKIWFGAPKSQPDIKSLLGIDVTYINYITGEKKETNYQGAPIEGSDVETKELIVKEGDYLSKFNIGFDQYVKHIKFGTLKGDKTEFGEIKEDIEKKLVNKLNEGNNIIINIKGYSSENGIRAIGYDYISLKEFCFIRWIDLFRIRNKLKDDNYKTEIQNKYNELNEKEKYFFRICSLPKVCFAAIIKYV